MSCLQRTLCWCYTVSFNAIFAYQFLYGHSIIKIKKSFILIEEIIFYMFWKEIQYQNELIFVE